MKRLDLVRKLEEEGARSSDAAAGTIGIKTLIRVFPHQYQAIVKSKNFYAKHILRKLKAGPM
jgi:hypothetical protein